MSCLGPRLTLTIRVCSWVVTNQMIIMENLEFAVIGNFSQGWPDLQDLRKFIPKQCESKGDFNIGLLSNQHVLIRSILLEDNVLFVFKSAFYNMQNNCSFPMRL